MIRALREDEADSFAELRRRALLDAPLTFASSPEDDAACSPDAVREQLRRGPDAVILGAFDPHLVGCVGLYRDRHVKSAHKMHLWGMYVAPERRGRGVGAALLTAAIAHARSVSGIAWVQLCVTSAATDARRLYERAGFVVWGTEPDALRQGGTSVVDHHMALRVTPSRP